MSNTVAPNVNADRTEWMQRNWDGMSGLPEVSNWLFWNSSEEEMNEVEHLPDSPKPIC